MEVMVQIIGERSTSFAKWAALNGAFECPDRQENVYFQWVQNSQGSHFLSESTKTLKLKMNGGWKEKSQKAIKKDKPVCSRRKFYNFVYLAAVIRGCYVECFTEISNGVSFIALLPMGFYKFQLLR